MAADDIKVFKKSGNLKVDIAHFPGRVVSSTVLLSNPRYRVGKAFEVESAMKELSVLGVGATEERAKGSGSGNVTYQFTKKRTEGLTENELLELMETLEGMGADVTRYERSLDEDNIEPRALQASSSKPVPSADGTKAKKRAGPEQVGAQVAVPVCEQEIQRCASRTRES